MVSFTRSLVLPEGVDRDPAFHGRRPGPALGSHDFAASAMTELKRDGGVDSYLTGETADSERDGQADAENVDDDADEHHFYGKGEFCGCGELYDDAIHEEVDGDAVKDTGQDGLIEQERHDPAGEEENCSSSEGDDEMQCETEERGRDAAGKSARAEDTAGDSL